MSERIVALIPARGGSKGVPRKNLRLLCGKPLVVYSIEAALEARLVDGVFVSTEDEEIARVARLAGADVIRRPDSLATDTAQNDAVVRHALETIGISEYRHVALLQPTSPLRTTADLDGCLNSYLGRSDIRSGMTITPTEHHPGKAVTVSAQGHIVPFTTIEDMEKRRQDMAVTYRQNGAVYVLRVCDFMQTGRFYLPPCVGYVMSPDDSVDIDREFDLRLATLVLEERRQRAAEHRERCA